MQATIFAPITPTIRSSTIIIRISGKDSLKILEKFKIKILPTPRFQHLIKLKDQKEELIDQALLTYFKAPNSYTGEDVIEIALHGSIAIYKQVIEILSQIDNFLFAEPGEFTKRAFLNQKIDLLQAEAIADLINAETEIQAKLALKSFSGETSSIFATLREKIISTRAFIESYIDFPDEDIPEEKLAESQEILNDIKTLIGKNLSSSLGESIRKGIKVAIIGPPNSGKSSLLNHLAKQDIAIVSNIAGTTRDSIETHLDIAGFPITLTDTAGLRENTNDEIEKIGIERSMKQAKIADFKLFLISSTEIETLAEYQKFIDKKTILIINKSDLSKAKAPNALNISVKTETGIQELFKILKNKISNEYQDLNDSIITRKRHRQILTEISTIIDIIDLKNQELEISAEQLRRISTEFSKLTGHIDIEDILDKIFSSFCIGK